MLFHNKEIIKREKLMCTNVKISNEKKLQLKALVNLECTYTAINKQLVKKEQIKTEPMDRSFEVFNTDKTKNGEVTRFKPLELEINRHTEKIDIAVTNLNSINMFLEYDWLIKYNPEVNWDKKQYGLQYV